MNNNCGFAQAEFIEQIRECAGVTSGRLGDLKSMIENRVDPDSELNLKKTLNAVSRMQFNARLARKNLEKTSYPRNLRLANALQGRLDLFTRAYKYLSQTTFQCLETSMIDQTYFRFLSLEQHEYAKALTAIQELAQFLLESYFPEQYLKKTVIVPSFGDTSLYHVLILGGQPRIACVEIPKVDAMRCRFWAWLGHEAFHHRYVLDFRHAKKREWEERKFQMTEDIRELGVRQWDVNSGKIAAGQFEEIVCDTVALLLLGPAYLLALSTNLMDPRLEAGSFGEHPPLTSRVTYLMSLLSRLGKGRFSAIMDAVKNPWDEELHSCGISYQQENYIKMYNELLKHYEENIMKLSFLYSSMIEKNLFDSTRWEVLTGILAGWRAGRSLSEWDLNCADLLNLVWLKRLDQFENIAKTKKHKRSFTVESKFDRKMTNDIIVYLYRRMRERGA